MSRRHFFQIVVILIALPLTACGERTDSQNRALAKSTDSDPLTEEQQEMIRQHFILRK